MAARHASRVTPIVSPRVAKSLPGHHQPARVCDREPAIYGLAILAGMDDFGNFTKLEIHRVGNTRSQGYGLHLLHAVIADSFNGSILNT
jgi:hypothetical protein